MALFKVENHRWDGTTFYKVETRDYVKGSFSWKERFVSFELKENKTKREFVVESVSDQENCENSPLHKLITGCKGAITARTIREDEKLF